ncbi:MAG: hypothetical protein GKR87_10185 [Kiritimatiellae bacterium]|nr:hypothetical protein [Kiritimatiellia bacterium]
MSIVLCGLALSASMSYGNVLIAWTAGEGFFITPPGLTGLLTENGVGSTLAQLIWAGTDNQETPLQIMEMGGQLIPTPPTL